MRTSRELRERRTTAAGLVGLPSLLVLCSVSSRAAMRRLPTLSIDPGNRTLDTYDYYTTRSIRPREREIFPPRWQSRVSMRPLMKVVLPPNPRRRAKYEEDPSDCALTRPNPTHGPLYPTKP